MYPSNRMRPVVIQNVSTAFLRHNRHRQKRLQMRFNADTTTPGPTTTMRSAKSLMQIQMHTVESRVPRPRNPNNRIHIRTVAKNLRPSAVYQFANLYDLILEQPQRRRI